MGDFNIDFGHKETSKCKNLKELMDEFSLRYHVTGYTRVTAGGKSIIDLIFSYMTDLPIYIIKNKSRNHVKKGVS